MYKKYGNKFYCFSPPVMLATFLIEFGLAIYVLWRYKSTEISRLVVLMLLLLGLFQLTEFMICGGLGLSHIEWARIGYVSITLLPAVGIHLILSVSKVKMRPLLLLAYGTAAAYVYYFALMTDSVISKVCSTNYAVFETHGIPGVLYIFYYYGWLLAAIALGAYIARKKPKLTRVLRWIAIGYCAFIIPTTLANILDSSTLNAIPSVMCGFAVLLAIVLVWRVLPLSKAPLAKR
jgi:hypothetical protein